MIHNSKKYVSTLPVLILLVILKACPSSSDLDRMAKASNELAHDTLTANRIVAEFYTSKKISLTAKDKAADLLGKIGDKGEAFNNLLIKLDKEYPQGTVPPATLQVLRANFAEISSLFQELWNELVPSKSTGAVKDLDKHVKEIKGVLDK